MVYSQALAEWQTELGRRFMLGYLRGVRDYNDAFARGGPTRCEEVVASRSAPPRWRSAAWTTSW